MLLNRIAEQARRTRLEGLLLRHRTRLPSHRPPLVFVPGMMGTTLVDSRGRTLWGSMRRLYWGPSFADAQGVRAETLLSGFTLMPGLWAYDVYGGLIRFLEDVGRYRLGEDLFVLEYDWRKGAVAGAGDLARLIRRIRGAGTERVDLVAASTGGTVVRTFLAYGDRDPTASEPEPSTSVRRVVYVGVPQRGTFDSIACLHRGFRFAPAGKRFTGQEAAKCQTCFDALPHPDDNVFVDTDGKAVDLSLYEAQVWSDLGLFPGAKDPDFAGRLERARRLHLALGQAMHSVDAIVIGARHLATPAKVLVKKGKAYIPFPRPSARDPFVGFTYLPGDGELPESSLRALPGLDEGRIWWVEPSAHHRLPADPRVHRWVLEALLATSRFIPCTDLSRKSSAAVRHSV